jgi:hypothetical protein
MRRLLGRNNSPGPILSPYRGPRGQVFVRGVVGRKGGRPQIQTRLSHSPWVRNHGGLKEQANLCENPAALLRRSIREARHVLDGMPTGVFSFQ